MPQSFILAGFWNLGHKLFRSTPETFPVTFVAGNAFDPQHLEVVPPFTKSNPPPAAPASLRDLMSLNPLRGHISAIHASSLFHLFQEADQLYLARVLAGLLSPEPGSMIFGSHAGLPEKGFPLNLGEDQKSMFYHSPDSWAALWDGEVFEKGTVRVDAVVVARSKEDAQRAIGTIDVQVYRLLWSVTRL
jgi:hypothetical protein